MVSLIWLAAPAFVFSIIIMWSSMRAMLSEESIREFLPFFFLSMALSFYGGAIVFKVFYGSLWTVIESFILICLIWILINVRRKLSW